MPTIQEKTNISVENEQEEENEQEQEESVPQYTDPSAMHSDALEDDKVMALLEEMRQVVESEEPQIFDSGVLRFEEMTEEEMETVFSESADMIRQQAEQEAQGNRPRPELGASEVPTLRVDGSLVEEKSGARYCLAGALEEKLPFGLCPTRIQHVEPQGQEGVGETTCPIPQPVTKKAQLALESGLSKGQWQREEVRAQSKQLLRKADLLPVNGGQATQVNGNEPRPGPQLQEWSVKAMDREAAMALCRGNLSEMHYLGSLFSGGGTAGEDEDGRPLPDYREISFQALTPEELDPVYDILQLGKFDGIVDGGSIYIPSKETESERPHRLLERQFRAASGTGPLSGADSKSESLEVLEEIGISKGTTQPVRRDYVRRRLSAFYDYKLPELKAAVEKAQVQNEAFQLGPTYYETGGPIIQPGHKEERELQRYLEAAGRLESALLGKDTLFLAKGDQIKVEGARDEGEALMSATFLKGEGASYHESPKDSEVDVSRSGEVAFARSRAHAQPEAPCQYAIKGNSQLFQLMKPKAGPAYWNHMKARVQEIFDQMSSPQGIAELVSQKEARDYEAVMEGKSREVDQDRNLLSVALHSGAIQMDSGAWERLANGGDTRPSDLHMPRQIRSRLDAVVASRLKNYVLRGQGIEGEGYIHHTIENSQSLLRRLWRQLPANGIDRERGLKWSVPDYPFYDRSSQVLPEKVTSLMNADDDGDLTIGFASHWELADGRVVKCVILWRYPCVDAPVAIFLPPETATPFDPANDRERKAYADVMEIFKPALKGGEPDIREDGITLAELTGVWRLSDKGAKSQVDKERKTGDVDLASAFSFCEGVAELNQAGPLTRALERFGELAYRTVSCSDDFEQLRPERQEKALEDFLHRAGKTQVRIEENLTAFKYDTDPNLQPPPYVPETEVLQDPLKHFSDDNVRDNVLPMDYHGQLDSVERVTKDHAREEETSLEGLDLRTGCRISKYLSYLVDTLIQDLIVEQGIHAIDTRPQYFTDRLEVRLTEWYNDGATEEQCRRVNRESHKARQAFSIWRSVWRKILQWQEEVIRQADPTAMEEALEDVAEKRGEASSTLRRFMRGVAAGMDRRSLQHALYSDWKGENPSTAAGMALVSDRLGEVFPKPNLTYSAPSSPEDSITVFTRGKDLPGDLVETTEVEKIALKDEGAVAEIRGEKYPLYSADGEDPIKDYLPASGATIARTERRRGVLYLEYE